MEPSNITKIAKDSMEKLNKVKNITLPSSLIEIGETGLKGLANLEWVIVPASVQIMGEKAFDEVSKNAKVYCEATSQPTGWNDKWLENNKVKVYWAGEWELNANGVPVAK